MAKHDVIKDTSFGTYCVDFAHNGKGRGFVVVILMRLFTKMNI
jgi:hypothetical protein